MTRKDYVALAEALHGAKPVPMAYQSAEAWEIGNVYWRECMIAISDVLAADNPRFDRERFIKACQGEK